MSTHLRRASLVLTMAALAAPAAAPRTARKFDLVVEADGDRPVAFTALLTSRGGERVDTVRGTTPARIGVWRYDRLYDRIELRSETPGRGLRIPATNFRRGLSSLTGVAAPRVVLRLGDDGLGVER